MNKQQLHCELDAALSALYDLFASLPAGAVNTTPFAGSWTPAQLVRHLVMANGGCLEELNGPVQDTTRPADAGVDQIRDTFLDFSVKFQSPEFVLPPAIDYDREELLTSLREIQSGLLAALDTQDLSQTCLLFELPVIGYLTRWEILHFVLYHTQRHRAQLEQMSGVLKAKALEWGSRG